MAPRIDFLGASQLILDSLDRRREREEAEQIISALSGGQALRPPNEQGFFARVLGGGNPFAPGPRGADSQPGPSPSTASGGKTPIDQNEATAYIKQAAAIRGIDPNTAVRVAKSEGLRSYVGDEGSSFGPFQLHYGGVARGGNAVGGLGDEFTKATGLDARDPATWRQQVDFSLDQAAKGGWGPWHGARKTGIGDFQGIGGKMADVAGAPSPLPPVGAGAAQTPSGQAMPQYSMDVIMRALMNPRTQALGNALLSSQLRTGSMEIIDVPVNNDDGSFKGIQKAFADPRTGKVVPFGGIDTSKAARAAVLPQSVQEFEYGRQHPDFAEYQRGKTPKAALPQSIQEFEYGRQNPDFAEYQRGKAAVRGPEAEAAERRRVAESAGLQGDDLRNYVLTGKLQGSNIEIIDVPVSNDDGSLKGVQKAFAEPRTGRVVPFGGIDTSKAAKAAALPQSVQEFQYGVENPAFAEYLRNKLAKPPVVPQSVQEFEYGQKYPAFAEYQRSKTAKPPVLPQSVQEFEYALQHPAFTEYQRGKVGAKGPEADVAARRRISEGAGLKGDEARNYILTGKLPAAYEKQTEGQANAALYADRMKEADAIIGAPEFTEAGTSLVQQGLASVPGAGNLLITENRQMLDQAKRNFINAALRRESGATIRDEEFENANKQYFPQPGDSSKTIVQKEQNRATAIRGISNAAGPAYAKREREAGQEPPPQPAGVRLGSVKIPPAAAQKLRANPDKRDDFDKMFGAGAADQVLGPIR